MAEFNKGEIHCFSYDWETKDVQPYDIIDFAEELCNIKEVICYLILQAGGFVMRTEAYSK